MELAIGFILVIALALTVFIIKIDRDKHPSENKIKFDACPNGYNRVIDSNETAHVIEQKCEPISGVAPVSAPTFYLDSKNPNICDSEEDWVNNGCFNDRPNRAKQCKAVREFLKGEDGILTGWPQFNVECQED